MSKIKILLNAVTIICLSQFSASAQLDSAPDWNVEVVRSIVSFSRIGATSGYEYKQNVRIGDDVARALRKVFNEREMLDSENLEICLRIVETSFSYPKAVRSKRMRKPHETLRLLNELKDKTSDDRKIRLINNTVLRLQSRIDEI